MNKKLKFNIKESRNLSTKIDKKNQNQLFSIESNNRLNKSIQNIISLFKEVFSLI